MSGEIRETKFDECETCAHVSDMRACRKCDCGELYDPVETETLDFTDPDLAEERIVEEAADKILAILGDKNVERNQHPANHRRRNRKAKAV